MERPVTMKEVARKAGVGIATVSRVLNNSERVDPATRERVMAVIRRLGYRPNAQGRRLVKRAAEMVCFVLCNRRFVNPFHSGILWGAERFLAQAGLDVVFTSLNHSAETPAAQLALPRILASRGIADGVIVSAPMACGGCCSGMGCGCRPMSAWSVSTTCRKPALPSRR